MVTKGHFNMGVNGFREVKLKAKEEPTGMLRDPMSPRIKKGKHGGYSPTNVAHDRRGTHVRFVVPQIDPDSQMELGVFQAMASLRRTGRLDQHEEAEDDRIGKWFDEHLKRPNRLTVSKPPYYRKQSKAISWFKDNAHEHIANIRLLAVILERHGIHVRMITTERVGYIVYEDEHQIVAEPFAGEDY